MSRTSFFFFSFCPNLFFFPRSKKKPFSLRVPFCQRTNSKEGLDRSTMIDVFRFSLYLPFFLECDFDFFFSLPFFFFIMFPSSSFFIVFCPVALQ